MYWQLKSFTTSGGRSIVDEWYDDQHSAVQADFDTSIEYLQRIERSQWVRPYASRLRGLCNGLYEIRFRSNNVQYRPIGFFGPGREEFTILICATERGGRFVPVNTCEIAQERKQAIIANPSRAVEL